MRGDVCISGLGLVSPAGTGASVAWEALRTATHALREDHRLRGRTYRPCYAGEVPDPASGWGAERMDAFAETAIREALADAGLSGAAARGVQAVVSTIFCFRPRMEDVLRDEGVEAGIDPGRYAPSRLARSLRGRLALEQAPLVISNACAGGSVAARIGCQLIETGQAEIVVAGGCEELSATVISLFQRLHIYAHGLPLPFGRSRSGTVLSEGAAFVVLERGASARARGVRPYCRVAGHGWSTDLGGTLGPDEGGRQTVATARQALAAAGLDPSAVGVAIAHGTATLANDVSEARGLSEVLAGNGHTPRVTGTKGALGHMQGASAATDLVAGALMLSTGEVPPVANTEPSDCGYDLPLQFETSGPLPGGAALVHSFGLGGIGCCTVLEAAGEGYRRA